ncbi:LOW QUALITY PROTEIN: leucine-rich repeat-containing protein 9 [Geothlypis trichas]
MAFCFQCCKVIAHLRKEKIENRWSSNCVNLQRIYCYCNEISRIENLEVLKKVNLLWLKKNLMKNMELKKQHLFPMFNIIVEEEKKNTERFILSHDL